MKGDRVLNTGKVLIGAAYQPRQRLQPSRDMERLQAALLAPRRPAPSLLRKLWSRHA